ncbi:MAG TPA: nuclear transport factor 2 family protein [Blastocatellia bacterium]|nr:nuclear transport factor 2 family protein [Blastocatellia bacterium]
MDAEIRRLDDQVRMAMLQKDIQALKHLCSEDFVVTNPFNQVVPLQQVLQAVEAGRINHSAFEREIEYLRTYTDSAVVMGRETVVDDGRTINRRYTEVWLKQDGRWQLVARHANIVQP